MDQIELKVDNREVLGKKVRFLRRQGITPVHLFGHGIKSVALQCDTDALKEVLAEAGKTRIISLKIGSEKRPRTVMAREIQKETQTSELIHVDFYQVRMAEEIKVEIPIILVGESPALKFKENTLAQELNSLAVECLPAKIPNHAEVDISSLAEPEQVLRVEDIKLDKEVTILSDPELVVARISSRPVEKIEEEEVVEEEVEAPEVVPSGEEESEEG